MCRHPICDYGNDRIREVEAATDIIRTLAGNGTSGFSGDGGLALDAALHGPSGATVDADGTLYFADQFNERVRRVSARGIIDTVAGDGMLGFSGDGGPAIRAQLNGVVATALDPSGNLYFSDQFNDRVRVVDAAGTIDTFAGSGLADDVPAARGQLAAPQGVTVSEGTLYIADGEDSRVRSVDRQGLLTTVAGNSDVIAIAGDGGQALDAALLSVAGVALDREGDLYILEGWGSNVVRKVDGRTGIIHAFTTDQPYLYACGQGLGDGGPVSQAGFCGISGIATDSAGNLYIADQGNGLVRKVDAQGIISTFAGTSPGYGGDGGLATSAQLGCPSAVTVDEEGSVYIADSCTGTVRKVDGQGIITTVAGDGDGGAGCGGGAGDGGPATSASFCAANGVAVDARGDLFISDPADGRVRKVERRTGLISTFAGNGTSGFSGDGGPADQAALAGIAGVAVDGEGNLYIADSGNDRIRRVESAHADTRAARLPSGWERGLE